MAEYIEREAALKKLNKNSITKIITLADGVSIYETINNIPTADVVEVVRCKDCKWYQEGEFFAPNKYCFRLEHPKEDRKIGYNYAPDDFCSYGVRRSDIE